MQHATVDRRSAARRPFNGLVIVTLPSGEISSVARNVSEGGMLLYAQHPPPVAVGEPLRVCFSLPSAWRWLAFDGTIAHATRRGPREAWGIRFDDVTPAERRLLREFTTPDAPNAAPPAIPRVPTPRPGQITMPEQPACQAPPGDDDEQATVLQKRTPASSFAKAGGDTKVGQAPDLSLEALALAARDDDD